MLRVLCKQVCWRRAPHLGESSLFPACALFANANPAPLEGRTHASKSSQGTHLRTGRLHCRRSRERSRGPYACRSSRGPEVCARCEDMERRKKNYTDEERGGRRDPGVRRPGAGRSQLPALSKSVLVILPFRSYLQIAISLISDQLSRTYFSWCVCVCVALFC